MKVPREITLGGNMQESTRSHSLKEAKRRKTNCRFGSDWLVGSTWSSG